MHYLNSYGTNEKKKILFFINYLKSETRKNSEKNYTNVSLDGKIRVMKDCSFRRRIENNKICST